MYEFKPTELWRERQELLLREVKERRLVRRLRKERPQRPFRTGHPPVEGLRRAMASWERTVVPFFRA
jgi:hypothetical protein